MTSDKNAPSYWRALAAQTRAAAEQLSDQKAILVLLRIAEAYDGLAERSEKNANVEKGNMK